MLLYGSIVLGNFVTKVKIVSQWITSNKKGGHFDREYGKRRVGVSE